MIDFRPYAALSGRQIPLLAELCLARRPCVSRELRITTFIFELLMDLMRV